jgi:hypothetical protein
MEPTMQLIFSALHSVTMCVFLAFFSGDEWLRADQKVTCSGRYSIACEFSAFPASCQNRVWLIHDTFHSPSLKAACTFVHSVLSGCGTVIDRRLTLFFVGQQIPFFSMIGSSRSSILTTFGLEG